MADHNKDLPEIVAEILIELQGIHGEMQEQRQQHKQDIDRIITTFNTGFMSVVEKLTSMDSEIKAIRQQTDRALDYEQKFKEIEHRLIRLEEKKGA
jgi:uncharacterized protein involved in exopolysaccharide biosynthesis